MIYSPKILKMFKTLKFITIFLCFSLWGIGIYGQEKAEKKRKKFIGFESGFEFMTSDVPDYTFIRGDIDYFGSGSATDYLDCLNREWYVGLKTEIRTKNDKFGLLTGFRYTRSNSYLSKSADSDYFYLLNTQDAQATEFLRIKLIDQYSDYIGIPVEIRYMPFRPRLFRLYVEIGAEFSYLINSDINVDFYNEAMEIYQDDVINKFTEPSTTYTSVYFAIGWNLNWKYKPVINLEAIIPSAFISDYSTGLINSIDGIGLQLNVQIPF